MGGAAPSVTGVFIWDCFRLNAAFWSEQAVATFGGLAEKIKTYWLSGRFLGCHAARANRDFSSFDIAVGCFADGDQSSSFIGNFAGGDKNTPPAGSFAACGGDFAV